MLSNRKNFFRFTFGGGQVAGKPLESSRPLPIVAGVIVAGMFAVFAGIWWSTFKQLHFSSTDGVASIMGSLFMVFWLMGWSMAVVVLGALTLVIFLLRETAYLSDGKLIAMLNVGPFGLRRDFDLERVSNLRVEPDRGGKTAKIKFEYDGVTCSSGNMLKPEVAERNLRLLQGEMDRAAFSTASDFEPKIEEPEPKIVIPRVTDYVPPKSHGTPWISMAVLVAANLIPLYWAVMGDWALEQVIVLCGAESAIVAFYTILKIAMVAKWWAPFPGIFFLAHFSGFMAIHFMFIYELFIRGIGTKGPEPAAFEVMQSLYTDLSPALLALFLSHGVSFVLNFTLFKSRGFVRAEFHHATRI